MRNLSEEPDPREEEMESMLMEMYQKNEIENKIISISMLEELPEDYSLQAISQPS